MLFASPYPRLATRIPVPFVLPLLVAFAVGCGAPDRSTIHDQEPPGASFSSPSSVSPSGADSDPDPASGARAEVAAAQGKYYTSFISALAAPGEQSRVDALLTSYTSTAAPRADIVEWMAYLARRGFAARPGPDTYWMIEKITLSGQRIDTAVARVCAYDDGVIFDARQRAPDGSEIIVDDRPLSERTDFTWVRREVWQIDSVRTTDTWEGRNGCPPREPS